MSDWDTVNGLAIEHRLTEFLHVPADIARSIRARVEDGARWRIMAESYRRRIAELEQLLPEQAVNAPPTEDTTRFTGD